ncbi:MAG TPA: hypothetical protein VGF99_16375, partial [Myxococcota bacterium]
FRAAHYADDALAALPFSIAEGLAARRKMPRDVMLRLLSSTMTHNEKLRLQESAARAGVDVDVDLSRAPLTKLWLYVLSLPLDERVRRRDELEAAIAAAAKRTLRRYPVAVTGPVAVVVDRSYSSSGSNERRRRPLGVALAVDSLVKAAAAATGTTSTTHWSTPQDDPLLTTPRGQTAIARPLLAALATTPALIIIVSDGVENDPPGGAAEVVRVWREKVASTQAAASTLFLHLNPVFSAADHAPVPLGDGIVTIGIRDADDVGVALGFARVAAGQASLAELSSWLAARVRGFITVGEGAA